MSYLTDSFPPFSALTTLLACAAAFASGRAIARAWAAWWLTIFAALPLAASARLLDFMLIEQTTNATVVVLSIGATMLIGYFGFRRYRSMQMARQYPWVVEG